jgi:hypothetical protein
MTGHPRTVVFVTGVLCLVLGGLVLAPSGIWTTYAPVPPRPPAGLLALAAPVQMPPFELPKERNFFEDQLREFTGPNARDCGRLDYRATEKRMRAALSCALAAAKLDRPFVVIKSEYGIDSWIPHGLVRGRTGPVLRFSYDDHLPSNRLAMEPCPSPVVKWEPDFREWKFMCAG